MLKQLFFNICNDTFIDAIRVYFKKQEWKNTERDDFIDLMAQNAHNFDVSKFCTDWICTPGLNGVQCAIETDESTGCCKSFKVHQYYYTNAIYKSFDTLIKV